MDRTKYPRTFNFPHSQSNSSDDVWWKDCSNFHDKEIIITEKLDGEATTVYPDGHTHARSVDSLHHPSRSWMKQFAGTFAHNIPEGYRVCGENLYAYHSIFYTDLPTYFFVYGIYDGDLCLSWSETVQFCELLGLDTVPVLYAGFWTENLKDEIWTGKGVYPTFETVVDDPSYPEDFTPCEAEGYVARLQSSFHYDDFRNCCAKWVRKNHVKTSSHWMERKPIPNLLAPFDKDLIA